MKKLFFSLVATVFFSLIGVAQDLSKLSEDVNFKNYVLRSFDFINFKTKVIDIETLEKIYSDKTIDDKEIDLFYKSFSISKNDFFTYYSSQNSILKELSEKYKFNDFSKETLIKELKTEVIQILSNDNKMKSMENLFNKNFSCYSDFALQVAENGAMAVAMGYGCVFAGPGALGCYAAIGAWNLIANIRAQRAYKACLAAN